MSKLTIDTRCDTKVGYHDVITGTVHPRIDRVQVLIHSDDGKWYLQKDADIFALGAWRATCVFGFPNSAPHAYQVVAVAGETIKTSPLDELPVTPFRSDIITVHRG